MCRSAYESVRELMAEAAGDPGLKPGMLAAVQRFGGGLAWHAPVHPLVTRGGRERVEAWTPIPQLAQAAAAELFPSKVFRIYAVKVSPRCTAACPRARSHFRRGEPSPETIQFGTP